MSPTAAAGLGLGTLCATSVLLLVAALQGWRPAHRIRDVRAGSARRSNRWIGALAAGVLVAATTRWPVAAIAAALLVLAWPRVFGAGGVAELELERLEALATWTESLRDSIAGSVGLEEAIRHSVSTAPRVLAPHLERLDGLLRVHMSLPRALSRFADELRDPSADLVLAALILNARLRGPGLVATLSALSASTREELDLRRRIEEGRKALRRTATIILAATALFAGGLVVLSRDYVAPYSSATGQLVLAVVIAVFAGGLVWIRSAAELRVPERFLDESAVVESGTVS